MGWHRWLGTTVGFRHFLLRVASAFRFDLLKSNNPLMILLISYHAARIQHFFGTTIGRIDEWFVWFGH
jgi:hypothetical protein